MKRLIEIINLISNDNNCKLYKNKKPIVVNANLPDDLKFFLENYGGIDFFPTQPYGIFIVGSDNFKNANKHFYDADDVIWEELEDDISNNWYIIGQNEEMDQYITIDLHQDRMGRCYDSFYSIHADPDFSPIIALNFTELLIQLHEAKGEYLYWNSSTFKSLGNAYF